MSLVRLLDEMIQAPQEYSREDFLSYYRPLGWTAEMDRKFHEFAGRGGDHLSRRILGADRAEFVRKAMKIQDFATSRIAHLLLKPTPRATYNELDDALDCLERLTEKYLLMFGNRGRRSGAVRMIVDGLRARSLVAGRRNELTATIIFPRTVKPARWSCAVAG